MVIWWFVVLPLFSKSQTGGNTHPKGAEVEVSWNGKCYPARVKQVGEGGRWYIGYEGWGSTWDGWVGADRIRARAGAAPSPSNPPQVATIPTPNPDPRPSPSTDRLCEVNGPDGSKLRFLCFNLGAVATADPYTPRWELNGDYYQWGRKNVAGPGPRDATEAGANAGPVVGWVNTSAPNASWWDDQKTVNDPCPTGFRVPTEAQWRSVIDKKLNPEIAFVGRMWNNILNYGSGLRIGSGSTGLYLPKAGSRGDVFARDGSLKDRGYFGKYWSSSETTGSNAVGLFFNFAGGYVQMSSYERSVALPVRCVEDRTAASAGTPTPSIRTNACVVNGAGGSKLTFSCFNLGAVATTDPYTPRWELNGDYYQWGRKTPAAFGPRNANGGGEALNGSWNRAAAGSGSWSGERKGPNDPCPPGFRVPGAWEWQMVKRHNSVVRYPGTWTEGSTNFSSGLRIGSGSTGLFLPAAGVRNSSDGSLSGRGSNGSYWSGTDSWRLTFYDGGFFTGNSMGKTNGMSVRCIAE